MPEQHHPTPEERDERLIVPLPPEKAIEAFLAVRPNRNGKGEIAEPVEPEEAPAE